MTPTRAEQAAEHLLHRLVREAAPPFGRPEREKWIHAIADALRACAEDCAAVADQNSGKYAADLIRTRWGIGG